MRLVLLTGPPAVGKMTVGRELARRSDLRLFHNHHTIEPLVEVFGYGTPPFRVLNTEFRVRVIEEAAIAGLDLVFTYVWDLESADEVDYVRRLTAPYLERGGDLVIVELLAGLETRLERNRGEERLAAKPTKRDLVWSEENVRQLETYRMSTPEGDAVRELEAYAVLGVHPRLRLDTEGASVEQTAQRILDWLAGLDVPAGVTDQ